MASSRGQLPSLTRKGRRRTSMITPPHGTSGTRVRFVRAPPEPCMRTSVAPAPCTPAAPVFMDKSPPLDAGLWTPLPPYLTTWPGCREGPASRRPEVQGMWGVGDPVKGSSLRAHATPPPGSQRGQAPSPVSASWYPGERRPARATLLPHQGCRSPGQGRAWASSQPCGWPVWRRSSRGTQTLGTRVCFFLY